jgi:YD repeat-containing protein
MKKILVFVTILSIFSTATALPAANEALDNVNCTADVKCTYDSSNHITSITDKQGKVTNFTYDKNGKVRAMTDSSGATVFYHYDSKGNVTSVPDVNHKGQ